MAILKTSPKQFLGAQIPNTKVLSPKIDEIIETINLIGTDGLVVASGSQVGSNTPTINQPSGTITVGSVATAGLASRTVTLTNSFITANSKVFVSLGDYGGTGVPIVQKVTPALGTVAIVIYNAHATIALSAAFDLDFFVVN
jgi:hypothetical protein